MIGKIMTAGYVTLLLAAAVSGYANGGTQPMGDAPSERGTSLWGLCGSVAAQGADGSAPQGGGQPAPEVVVVVEPSDQSWESAFEMSYERYHALSGEEQQAFFESFESVEAFFEWYNAAQAEWEANSGAIEIGEGTVIDLSRVTG